MDFTLSERSVLYSKSLWVLGTFSYWSKSVPVWTVFNTAPFQFCLCEWVIFKYWHHSSHSIRFAPPLLCFPSSSLRDTHTCGCVHTHACLLYGQGLLSLKNGVVDEAKVIYHWVLPSLIRSVWVRNSDCFTLSIRARYLDLLVNAPPYLGISFSKMIS